MTRSYATAKVVPESKPVDSRWLSQISQRVGKCLTFGLPEDHSRAAAEVCNELALDWRELVAGSEGYLTGKGRRGLYRHQVVWGEQDSMVRNAVF